MSGSNSIIKEINERRAYRDFDKKPVPRETILRILQAAHLAPSCFNHQPWRFLVMDEEESLKLGLDSLSRGNAWANESSFVVAVATREDLDCKLSDNRNYALFDTGLAVGNMLLQAEREGLTGHPMAGYDPRSFKEFFRIPGDFQVIALIAFGYRRKSPKETLPPRERRPLEEVVHFNAWDSRKSPAAPAP